MLAQSNFPVTEGFVMRFSMIVAAISFTGLAATASLAQSRSDALRDLLSFVPLSVVAGPQSPDLEFADLIAAARVMAQPASGGSDAFRGPYRALYRAQPSMFYDAMQPAQIEQWPALMGFAWDDVEATLMLARSPQRLRLVSLSDKAVPGVWPALLAAGYAEGIIAETPALIRGDEDFAIDIEGRNPADPFGGNLGQSSRLVMFENTLVQAPDRGMLEAVLARGPAMTDDPEIAAMLDALDDPNLGREPLVRATFLFSAAQVPFAVSAGVPEWRIALLADISGADMDTTVLIIAYDDPETAARAADAVSIAWRDLPSVVTGKSMAQLRGNDLITWVTGPFTGPDDGPSVMIAILSEPAEALNGIVRNATANAIQQAYMMRDLGFLAP